MEVNNDRGTAVKLILALVLLAINHRALVEVSLKV
jgi:hypothetical protein